ncbi:MAG: type II toxin-antitoxin system VapC family toxin [Thermodesulfobacteriota bacterium]
MITAVDTNVLVDILEPDPVHGNTSLMLLKQAMHEGSVVACEVVWAEVATAYEEKMSDLLSALTQAGIRFMPMNEAAALKSAQCWRACRRKGGKKGRIAADFLIGGHALVQCDRLLTRDKGFYRDYFEPLCLLTSGQPMPL